MAEKRKKKEKTFSVEELYRNKNFVPPKEKNLETIFEEPRESKDGLPVLTSTRKFKRYLHFDTTVGKIHKRKIRAKKCVKKLNMNRLKTRSSPKKSEESVDISSYISEAIGDSSEDDMGTTTTKEVSISDSKTEPIIDLPVITSNNSCLEDIKDSSSNKSSNNEELVENLLAINSQSNKDPSPDASHTCKKDSKDDNSPRNSCHIS